MMQVTLLHNTDVDLVWHRIKEYVEGAAEYTYGRFTAQDIRTRARESDQQVWIAHDGDEVYGFVITQVSDYPQLKSLVMHFTGGKDLMEWKGIMLQRLQEFAAVCGCDIIESFGRGGWGKVFKDDGFQSRFTFYELPVEIVQ